MRPGRLRLSKKHRERAAVLRWLRRMGIMLTPPPIKWFSLRVKK